MCILLMDKCPRASISVMTGKRLQLKSGLLILAHNLYTHSLCINSKKYFYQDLCENCAALDGIFQNLRFCVYFAYGKVSQSLYQCHNREISITQIWPVDTYP